jgi:hypothetical protein
MIDIVRAGGAITGPWAFVLGTWSVPWSQVPGPRCVSEDEGPRTKDGRRTKDGTKYQAPRTTDESYCRWKRATRTALPST